MINIPIAILRGVETSLPFLANAAKAHMIIGVNVMTKNGLIHCQISGGIAFVKTKSRAKTESDCPFWWNANQKNAAIPNTAKRAYNLCLISFALAASSSCVYSFSTIYG